jgi:hypothetical protein
MKRVMSIFIIFIVGLCVCTTTIAQDVQGSPFSEYLSNASWKEQTFFLDDFAIFLNKHPETVGFIFLYARSGDSKKMVLNRISRGVKYLSKQNGIPKSRLRICYRGRGLYSKVVLQPIDRKMAATEPCRQ